VFAPTLEKALTFLDDKLLLPVNISGLRVDKQQSTCQSGTKFKEVKLMARIRIILEDDEGHEMQHEQPRVYELGSGLERLRAIEAAVEQFKRAALPDLEAELLALAQERFVVEPLKKGG